MEDKLFDTQAKKDEAVMLFNELIVHPGWLLLKKIIQANVENLRNGLENPDSEDTMEDIKVNRRLLRFYTRTLSMPEDKVKEFIGGVQSLDPKLDPYDQETIKKKK